MLVKIERIYGLVLEVYGMKDKVLKGRFSSTLEWFPCLLEHILYKRFCLNREKAESSYNRDNYNMILLQNWIVSNQLINKKIYFHPSLNKSKTNLALQLRFGGRPQQQIWENHAQRTLHFSQYKPNLGKPFFIKVNWARSGQNPCPGFLRFVFICWKYQPQNCHSLFQRIFKLTLLKIKSSIWKLPWRLKMVNNVTTNLLELSLVK